MSTAGEEFIRITAVCGSVSENSKTKIALTRVIEGAAETGITTELIELRDCELVFCGQVNPTDYPADVKRVRQTLRDSQGIILGTPEYHGSLSGALKTLLDLMGPDEFEGKIVALVGVAGGQTGAIQSLSTLRTIGRNLHCWVLPEQVSIAESGTAFSDDGHAINPAIDERLLNLGRQVVRLALVQRKYRQDQFMKMWEGMPRW